MSTWPPSLPDHQLVERWRPMHPADLEELRTSQRLGPCEGIECVARSRESGRLELVTALRPVAASEAPNVDHDEEDARRALATVRARWVAARPLDAAELRRTLVALLPGALLIEIRGAVRQLRAFVQTPAGRWRSAYVHSVEDVRRFAVTGAQRRTA